MSLEIRPLRRRDHRRAMRFAFTGMHFQWYTDNRLLLFLYSRYFWYLELGRATRVFAAYEGGALAGVLLARFEGERVAQPSLWRAAFVKCFDCLEHLLFPGGGSVYEDANRALYAQYRRHCAPDGELLFLAADPEMPRRGVGTLLLRALEAAAPGKTVYLYTDDGCNYAFYEHRGFDLAGERRIALEITGKHVDLRCMLYSKRLGA